MVVEASSLYQRAGHPTVIMGTIWAVLSGPNFSL